MSEGLRQFCHRFLVNTPIDIWGELHPALMDIHSIDPMAEKIELSTHGLTIAFYTQNDINISQIESIVQTLGLYNIKAKYLAP